MQKYLITWIGGKRLLRKTIAPLIPEDIQTYVEPFGGGGWMLFFKPRWATCEIYNDLNGSLVNLFMMVKYHPKRLKQELQYTLKSRELFYKLRDLEDDKLLSVQRAARFLYLLTYSFGAVVNRKASFGVSKTTPAKNIDRIFERIDEIYERLKLVTIENQDFQRCIDLYDSEKSFFYCDPPYRLNNESRYYQGAFEHKRLFKVLSNIKGRFLLSYNDCEEIRELYKNFSIIEVSRQKGIANKQGYQEFKELLISNYPLEVN